MKSDHRNTFRDLLFAFGFIATAVLCGIIAFLASPDNVTRFFAADRQIDTFKQHYLFIFRLLLGVNAATFFAIGVVFLIGKSSTTAASREKPELAASEWRLFGISFIILFLELSFIRWIPAYNQLLGYFSNFILLACFFGMGLGCLAAGRKRSYLSWTAPCVFVTVSVTGVLYTLNKFELLSNRISSAGKDIYFFGNVEAQGTRFAHVPVEALLVVYFVLMVFVFVGPGQAMGRLFEKFPPLRAYMFNIFGSLAGILAFILLARFSAPGWVWFLISSVGLLPFLSRDPAVRRVCPHVALIAGSLAVVIALQVSSPEIKNFWSPYYRIVYHENEAGTRYISVNEVGHQALFPKNEFHYLIHFFPYLVFEQSGVPTPESVLVIGAGMGNDARAALRFGVPDIDVVEIDPRILQLGKRYNPDRPYQDSRVHTYVDDGRSFLKRSSKKYDLIAFGMVDSITLLSSYSSVRLESFLFTEESFKSVKERLNPDGIFLVYNQFREPFVALRIADMLERVFGEEPVFFTFPPSETLKSDSPNTAHISFMMVGNVENIRRVFERYPALSVGGSWWKRDRLELVPLPAAAPERKDAIALTKILPAEQEKRIRIVDDWPFLYLRHRSIPPHNILGLGILLGLSIILLAAFRRGASGGIGLPFFFLGAAFMLLETSAITRMSLLFGSTWIVNSVVFFSILVMVFLANGILLTKPKLPVFWAVPLLLLALLLQYFLPLSAFLGGGFWMRTALPCLFVFLPIFFGGFIFSSMFRKSKNPSSDFGWNLLGVIMGGAAEYLSLIWGFQALLLLAMAMYGAAVITGAGLMREGKTNIIHR